jgi:hypothetical protein
MALPTYDITIDKDYAEDGQDLGIDMIAFTAKPAIIVKGVAYNQNEPIKLFFRNDIKQRITAPVMIPMEIYRRDDDDYEYNTRFSAEVIEELHSKLMKDLHNKDLFNVDHNASDKVPAYILEAWIVEDPKTDKAKTTYNIDVPKGTLMMTTQITDEAYYNQLVDSGKVGFSIEGYLGMKLKEEYQKQYSMKLPDGEHLIEGKIYVVEGGEVIEIKDVPVEASTDEEKEETKEEEMSSTEETETTEEEKTTEEEMAEEPATETPQTAVSEAEVMAIVQPYLDEILKIVADVKGMISQAEPEEETEMSEQKFTAHDRLKSFMNFSKTK